MATVQEHLAAPISGLDAGGPAVVLEPQGVESWPLGALREEQERRLRDGQLLERAAQSSLYAGRWPRLARPGGRRVLQTLPFTAPGDLLRAESGRRLRGLAVSPVCSWLSSASTTQRRWIPYGAQDLLRAMGLAGRLIRLLGLGPGEVVLFASQPAPLFQNALPYLWLYGDRWDTGLRLELIVGSMLMAEHNNWPEFGLRRQPHLLVARPGDALALAGRFARAAEAPPDRPREAFQRLRGGLFYGEPLGPHREELQAAYGLQAFGCYASAEFPHYACECGAHQGLHVWLDLAVPEIIPGEELARAEARRGYRPEALFLDEAPPGIEGELVVTTFAQALPMVRYRTGDRVRVLGLDPCLCGRTHPRIDVLGRL